MREIKCPACGTGNAPGQRFCGDCGASLEQVCAACGASNPSPFRFCGSCGAPLDASVSRRDETEERRWATVLFADLSGFTSLSEHADPEDVRALVDRCMDAMGEIVEKFGGHVSRVSGDEMLALFGAPVAHEDDPERAVRTGLEMQRCAAENIEDFGRLSLRVGINTGDLMFAPVGPQGAREQTVLGDTVNTAKRLESAAPIGGVLVGEQTYLATRASIRYDSVDAIRAKGKNDLVRAWLAVEPVAEVGQRAVSEVPIVGRNRELDLLKTIWHRTVDESRSHLVTVMGAPGIGKTRIEREFVGGLGPEVQVLRGRALPYGEQTGYGAFAEQIKQAAGIYQTDPGPTARSKLEAFVAGLSPNAQPTEVASHVALLVGLGGDSGVRDRAPLFLSARRLIEAMATRAPLLVVFEDIHWADHSLLDLIEFLAARIHDAPVLLLALARPELVEDRSSWAGGLANATSVRVDALTVAEARSLASRLLPQVTDPEVLDRLADVAGGNPLFLEELAASYAERTHDMVERLPTSVHGIIAARLDALPPTERRVLLDAAVVGKVFWRGVLESVATGEPVWEALDSLQARDLVHREPASRIEADEQYVFKHMLIREVAYSTLSKAARRERHSRIAQHIEQAVGDRVPEHASVLAHHLLEAGEHDRAADFLMQAAEHAHRAFAPFESITLYDQALELMDAQDSRRDEALLKRALARYRAGDFARVAEEIEELRPRLHGRDLVTALQIQAKVAFWLAETEEVNRLADELGEIAERTDDLVARAFSLTMRCHGTSLTGALDEAVRLGEEAVQIWPPQAPSEELAYLFALLGLVRYWRGDLERSRELTEDGYRLGLTHYGAEGLLNNGANYALSLSATGRYTQSLELFEDLLAKGKELEVVPRWSSRAMNMCAGTLREIHDFEAARRLNEKGVEAAEAAGFPTGAAQGRVDLLFADVTDDAVGRADAAWPGLIEEAASLRGFHEWLVRLRLLSARAEIDLASGRVDEACTSAERAIAEAERYGRLKYAVSSRLVLSRALAASRPEQAPPQSRRAMDDAERLGHQPTLWRASTVLSDVLYLVGDDEGAEAASTRAKQVVDKVAESLSPERRAVFLASEPLGR